MKRRAHAPVMPRPRAMAGFTLLELMIVLFIIALMTGIGIALLGDSAEQRQRAQVQGLVTQFGLARETAVRTGQVIGWHSQGGQYRYVRLRGSAQGPRWSDLQAEGLANGALPAALTLAGAPASPRVVWWPNGESAGARLDFASATQAYTVTVNRFGDARMVDP